MSELPHARLSVVILNYRTADLVVDCLRTLVPQLDHAQDRVVVVDNDSQDGSAEAIRQAIEEGGWASVCRVVEAGINGGFSAGNNVGVHAQPASIYYLINSDTLLREGSIAALLDHMDRYPAHGLVGPRLEWLDEEPQISRFRLTTPLTEFTRAAGIGVIDRLFKRHVNSIADHEDDPIGWLSFAAIAIRSTAWEKIGAMDDGYFMYYEDLDYGRRARQAGIELGFCAQARVVHLQGGSTTKKQAAGEPKRQPPFAYAARSRYFAKYYGVFGPVIANLCWTLGWMISLVRRVVGPNGKKPLPLQWRDVWHRSFDPMKPRAVRFRW